MAIAEKGPAHNLAQRITDLETAVQKLSTQDVLLNATFGPGLTVAQAYAQLINAIATNVVPEVGSASASGYALTTSQQTLCTVNFTVPTGYTRALVTGITSVSLANQSNSLADFCQAQVTISGSGPTRNSTELNPITIGNVGSAFSRSLTGLTAGGNLPVSSLANNTQGVTGPTSSFNIATLTATALFLP